MNTNTNTANPVMNTTTSDQIILQSMLQLQNVSKAFFGVPAVKVVTLNIPTGQITGLIGQNGAGKSTLMNMVGGVVTPDSGVMLLDDMPYTPRNPRAAQNAGVAFIHQELNLFSNLSLAENIFIDKFPRRNGLPLIDRGAMKRRTRELLAQVDLNVPPETLIDQLSPGERQLVEIAKALHADARLIIFDEPTTSLTARETEKLFGIMRGLRAQGKTMIYISHILNDVLTLSDQIAVMRDGELVSTGPAATYDTNSMIASMVGRNLEQLYPPRLNHPTPTPILSVQDLSQPGIVKNIGLTVYQGEVVGLFGLMGSGRTELARILFGLDDFASGTITIQGQQITHSNTFSARESIRKHVAFVTENRREEGLLMTGLITDNIALVSLPEFADRLTQTIDQDRLTAATRQSAEGMQIKAGSIERQTAKSLSGGNQQKVVIAKWLLSRPTLFIMDEPTRGIDVGAKYEIYSVINALAADQCGVLIISSELEELIGTCDRILVMSQGEIVGSFVPDEYDHERILRAAFREGANITPAQAVAETVTGTGIQTGAIQHG